MISLRVLVVFVFKLQSVVHGRRHDLSENRWMILDSPTHYFKPAISPSPVTFTFSTWLEQLTLCNKIFDPLCFLYSREDSHWSTMPRQQRQRQLNTGTTTSTTTSDSESAINAASFPRTLRLRGESQSHAVTVGDRSRTETPAQEEAEESSASRRVRWDENVVNNEGMGKKSSKGCSASISAKWNSGYDLLICFLLV